MVRIALFATHPLGTRCLQLLDKHPDVTIALIVTYPEEHQTWWDAKVSQAASKLGYHFEPIENEAEVFEYGIDYLVSVYYPNILDSEMLNHPEEGAINLHQAELPRYRGSNVFAHAIMNARNDDHWEYGTTIHKMVENVDAGPIIDCEFIEIRETDTARSLYERTNEASVRLFNRLIPALVEGNILDDVTPQDEFPDKRYFYPKDSLEGEDQISIDSIRDDGTQLETFDKIRALEFPPHEPAHIKMGGRKVHLTTEPPWDV